MKNQEKVFWGWVADRLVKASLIGFALAGCAGEALRLLVAYKVVTL